ncbi:amidophosphoribosyltransferase [Oceanispirochaeta sp.]|jgi:amidophosphoribosyltransferase|uniref:amidophosphoribosyltransferase n=1 Tax=Oceanispirochaeta sp. TaxID=2035350 RepID=UPI0026280044|nr:amidophosphoribosyltransferase [Oceanispirochaeta sp.]MDA3958118.1 amidophosphoribosyltransferase [Oceanispirochaeta sp.]
MMPSEEFPGDDKLHEECGVFGVYSPKEYPVGEMTYLGLLGLQHRGQESAGITISSGGVLTTRKGMGLVTEVFKNDAIIELKTGNAAIGHVRYSTTGNSDLANAQPLEGHCKLGSLAVAHNGNLVNSEIIRSLMEDGGAIFQTTSDTEVILNMIARGAVKGIEKAVREAAGAIKGSYAIVLFIDNKLIGVRDPYGIRPLCLGKLDDAWILSSESCALNTVGAEFVRDLEPGEIVVIDEKGVTSLGYDSSSKLSTCIFEDIYFARPDSQIDGINVMQARKRCGAEYFKENPIDADMVVAVPDSGISAAIGYSEASGIPFEMGFIKNRYIGRTFISPSQELREKAVSVKLNVVKSVVEVKRVILIDDSIVRGTTSRHLVALMRKAGASEVHLGIVSPPIKYSCYFGIDTPDTEQLIATGRDVEEICREIGADSLGYISLDGLTRALSTEEMHFCNGCLTGTYPLTPNN